MTCERVQENIILAQYGELPDELAHGLELHLATCENCGREWNAMLALHEELSLSPMTEPDPNLLAAARMRLDEALDNIPAQSFVQRAFSNAFRWGGFLRGAPALATLLLGAGFLSGTVLTRYQAEKSQLPRPMVLSGSSAGPIASVSGIIQTSDQNIVQVKYNRLVPEMVEGSLEDPQVRQLLMLGTKLATDNEVHAQSVAMLSDECRAGHACAGNPDNVTNGNVRGALLASLHYDKNPAVRLKALQGLQPYVAEDQRVRDAVLDSLMHDNSATVRTEAISMLSPVGADSSVRQALRTVSSQDVNPAIRTASFHALEGSADVQ